MGTGWAKLAASPFRFRRLKPPAKRSGGRREVAKRVRGWVWEAGVEEGAKGCRGEAGARAGGGGSVGGFAWESPHWERGGEAEGTKEKRGGGGKVSGELGECTGEKFRERRCGEAFLECGQMRVRF